MNKLDKRWLKWPAVYFGNKAPIADEVWRRFGNVDRYFEPFCGSCGVFWKRPLSHFQDGHSRREVLNDLSGYLVNFLRAIKHCPKETAEESVWPTSEIDLIARYRYLAFGKGKKFIRSLKADPIHCDVRLGAWWAWGMSLWIGNDGFLKMHGDNWNKLPELQTQKGLLRPAKVSVTENGYEAEEKRIKKLVKWFKTLSERLTYVDIVCGDWERPLASESLLRGATAGKVGVFLDPPYPVIREDGKSCQLVYEKGEGKVDELVELRKRVYHWCRKNGNGNVRVAVCGYEGDYDKLAVKHGWEVFKWKTNGGFANTGGKGHESLGKMNRNRERIWFSPNCLKPPILF